MTDDDGIFIQQALYGGGVILRDESLENLAAGTQWMVFIGEHVFNAHHQTSEPPRGSVLNLLIYFGCARNRFSAIHAQKNIEVRFILDISGIELDEFPAGEHTTLQIVPNVPK
jgi:hypothetical protein